MTVSHRLLPIGALLVLVTAPTHAICPDGTNSDDDADGSCLAHLVVAP